MTEFEYNNGCIRTYSYTPCAVRRHKAGRGYISTALARTLEYSPVGEGQGGEGRRAGGGFFRCTFFGYAIVVRCMWTRVWSLPQARHARVAVPLIFNIRRGTTRTGGLAAPRTLLRIVINSRVPGKVSGTRCVDVGIANNDTVLLGFIELPFCRIYDEIFARSMDIRNRSN